MRMGKRAMIAMEFYNKLLALPVGEKQKWIIAVKGKFIKLNIEVSADKKDLNIINHEYLDLGFNREWYKDQQDLTIERWLRSDQSELNKPVCCPDCDTCLEGKPWCDVCSWNVLKKGKDNE